MTLLNDKIAIITGASSGIGRAAAKLFARQGAKLVVTGRRQDALDAVIAEIEAEGGQAVAISGDVKDEALQARLVETAVSRFGGLDIAFN
ncbi:SDR family NAD(P)-dependent oxidoreductase, partial [Rhizobium johnstonii]